MANVNFFYSQYCTSFMTIDENEQGLFCQVPSESNGESYTVQVNESGVCPVVSSCQCMGYRHHGHCKHEAIVNAFYTKIYKSNIAKASEKALEQAMDASDEQEESYELAAIADQVQAAPIAKISQDMASTVKSAELSNGSMSPLRAWVDGTISTKELVEQTVFSRGTTSGATRVSSSDECHERAMPVAKKIDHYSIRTASFFGGLPSRKGNT